MSMTQADALATLGELENDLAHYGVKGMKWGVIREKITTPKVSAHDIRDARKSVAGQQRAITKKRLKRVVTVDKEKRAASKKEISKMSAKLLRDPDRATALRMTRGEKAVLALFAIPTSSATLVSAPAIAGAAAAGQYISRKKVESHQAHLKKKDAAKR